MSTPNNRRRDPGGFGAETMMLVIGIGGVADGHAGGSTRRPFRRKWALRFSYGWSRVAKAYSRWARPCLAWWKCQ